MASITSVELNFLVYRYLQESGLTHAAFALGYEAGIDKCPIDGNLVPPGSLITFVQKGLQYLEMEANLNNSDADADEDFSFLQPLDLITRDVNELQRMVKEKRQSSRKDKEKEAEERDRERKRGRDNRRLDREKDHAKDGEGKEKDDNSGKEKEEKSGKEEEKVGRERDERYVKVRDKKIGKERNENFVRESDGRAGKERDEKAGKEREEKSGKERDEKSGKERDEKAGKERDEKAGKERDEKAGKEEKPLKEAEEKPFKEREEKLAKEEEKHGNVRDEKVVKERNDRAKLPDGPPDKEKVVEQQEKPTFRREDTGVSHDAAEPMDICPSTMSRVLEISGSDVTILEGHTSEVCACAWSPSGSLLASGSGDSTARIWTVSNKGSTTRNASADVVVLKHVKGKTNEKSKDVTTLDWNVDGTFLATGSYDGHARIWNTNGDLKSTLSRHKGPIFSLKWNKKGDYLLTGSCDKTAIVWDVKAEVPRQQFEFHTGPTLDVDWRNNNSFATSSTDNMIYVCELGVNSPIKTFAGHQGEVNCVKWDPTGTLLASCSDDNTAKIWSMKHDTFVCNLKEHLKEIYTIRWSPTGAGTNNPNQQLVLASASFDSTVKIWDAEHGNLLHNLDGHKEAVYSLAFSPNGKYLASGSFDRSLFVWSLKDGNIIKKYSGNGGIFEVCWNKEGDKIAACFANNTVSVLDFRT